MLQCATNVTSSWFPLVLSAINGGGLFAFVRRILLAKACISQASLHLQLIHSLFYLTVSSAFGRTSVKSVLTVPKPFKWLPSRQLSGDVLNNKLALHRAEMRYFTIPLCEFKGGKKKGTKHAFGSSFLTSTPRRV